MLRALRRLLRRGGRTAFTTIGVAPGLAPAARRRAHRRGPRAVASRSEPGRLMVSAGFVGVEVDDVTAAFVDTTRAWIDQREAHAGELEPLEPPGVFAQRLAEQRAQLAATEDGLLRRWVVSARRP